MSGSQDDTIAALDLGSSKVACFIARVDDAGGIRVLGIGMRQCRGLKSGVVVDMDETEQAIRAAVERAERMAGETIDSVTVALSAGELESRIFEVDLEIAGYRVDQSDIARVLDEARAAIPQSDRRIIHAFPVCFTLDGADGVRAPVGMYGERLAVTMQVVTALPGPVRNLQACIEQAHLRVAGFVASPYAAGLGALVGDEAELGAACIDIGGGTTQLAVFAGGALVTAEVLPMGGYHVTQDIARGLLTSIEQAERLKTLHGSAFAAPGDERESIEVPRLGEAGGDGEGQNGLPRARLTGIIQPRLEELLEGVRERLIVNGFDGPSAQRVVLTGGAAQLPGMGELAQRVLEKGVRIGRPVGVSGLAEATSGPAFSACAGLLRYRIAAPAEAVEAGRAQPAGAPPRGGLGRVGRWLKENF